VPQRGAVGDPSRRHLHLGRLGRGTGPRPRSDTRHPSALSTYCNAGIGSEAHDARPHTWDAAPADIAVAHLPMGRFAVGAGKAWRRVRPFLGQSPILTEGPIWAAAGERAAVSRIVYRMDVDQSRWELLDSVGGDALGVQGTTNRTAVRGTQTTSWILPTGTYHLKTVRVARNHHLKALDDDATGMTVFSGYFGDRWFTGDRQTFTVRDVGVGGFAPARSGETVIREVWRSGVIVMTLRWLPPVRRSYSHGGLWLGEAIVHPDMPNTADPLLMTVFLLGGFVLACTPPAGG
jgi:hypothetical protein